MKLFAYIFAGVSTSMLLGSVTLVWLGPFGAVIATGAVFAVGIVMAKFYEDL